MDCARAGRVKHGCGGPIAGRLVLGFQAKSWTAAIILVRDGGDWSAQSRTAILTAAAFGRLIYGHLEGLRTRDFDYPAYRAYVAGAAICIVRIVAPSKSPSANAVGCGRNMTQTTAKESAQGDRGGRRQYDGKALSPRCRISIPSGKRYGGVGGASATGDPIFNCLDRMFLVAPPRTNGLREDGPPPAYRSGRR